MIVLQTEVYLPKQHSDMSFMTFVVPNKVRLFLIIFNQSTYG